jgi:hypothetical protein
LNFSSKLAPYNKNCALRLKTANTRMFSIDILMNKNEETDYFSKTIDLADGKYHYQYKIFTKSLFEQSPQPAQPTFLRGPKKAYTFLFFLHIYKLLTKNFHIY